MIMEKAQFGSCSKMVGGELASDMEINNATQECWGHTGTKALGEGVLSFLKEVA